MKSYLFLCIITIENAYVYLHCARCMNGIWNALCQHNNDNLIFCTVNRTISRNGIVLHANSYYDDDIMYDCVMFVKGLHTYFSSIYNNDSLLFIHNQEVTVSYNLQIYVISTFFFSIKSESITRMIVNEVVDMEIIFVVIWLSRKICW